MTTITVYLDQSEEDERKRRRRAKGIVAMVLATAAGVLAFGKTSKPPFPLPPEPIIVYVPAEPAVIYLRDYAGPIGPQRPQPDIDRVERLIVSDKPFPQAILENPTLTGHPRHLCINPTSIHFRTAGLETITLTNPDEAPVHVTRIAARGMDGDDLLGYEIAASSCEKTLAPGEQCRFSILATTLALRMRERISIEVSYDGPFDSAQGKPRRSMRSAMEVASLERAR